MELASTDGGGTQESSTRQLEIIRDTVRLVGGGGGAGGGERREANITPPLWRCCTPAHYSVVSQGCVQTVYAADYTTVYVTQGRKC